MSVAEDNFHPLRETVWETLRTRIFEGRYPPGTYLVERDLAAEFNVSRLPVREALRMLRQEGLLGDPGHRGAPIKPLKAKEVEDLAHLRRSLEVLACQLAAHRATQQDLARLASYLERAGLCLVRGAEAEAYEANIEFHAEIVKIANNDFLSSAFEPVQGRMNWLFHQPRDLQELTKDHRELFAALASGRVDVAAAASAAHISKYPARFPRSPHQRTQFEMISSNNKLVPKVN
ncbi:GntR family transcriptional regulator [Arthrobacter sp. M4]|uniref:GntR family transcriptional regulator n=1 Tax=Arthrobacter sp. M4 TaxID=218160 RepID=UPI001CDD2A6D|nr:GntR family transcriptional regulator [Arthrobacter sp. M4]MCA4133778.1 GntR family transcriptional regulator [Arthrobacter sp. M4]